MPLSGSGLDPAPHLQTARGSHSHLGHGVDEGPELGLVSVRRDNPRPELKTVDELPVVALPVRLLGALSQGNAHPHGELRRVHLGRVLGPVLCKTTSRG